MSVLDRPRRDWVEVAVYAFAPVIALGAGALVSRSWPLVVAGVMAGAVLLVALSRPKWLLAFVVITGCLPLNFVTEGQRSVLSSAGGSTVSGVLLVVYVGVLGVVLIANRQLVGGLAVFAIPLVWVAWATFTLVYTDWADEGIRLAFKLWYPFLVGIMAYYWCRRPGGVRDIRMWWYVGFVLVTVIALLRLAVVGAAAFAEDGLYRYSSFSHPSPFSFFMLVTFTFAYALWSSSRRRLDGVVALVAAVQVVASLTRISIAALVVSILVMTVLHMSSPWRVLRGVLIALAVVAVLVMGLLASPTLQSRVFFEPVSSVGEMVANPDNLDTKGRDAVWSAIITDYDSGDTAGGRGLGSSTRLFRLGEIAGSLAGKTAAVHNEYLRVLYEQGALGLTVFIAMLVGSFAFLASCVRRGRGLERALLSAAAAAVAAYAIVAITDNALDYYNIMGQYVVLLAAMGLALRSLRRSGSSLADTGGEL